MAFCSGGDQKYKSHEGGYLDSDGLARLNVLDLQRQIRSLPIPVIALVNGYAIGGGHVLHVVCDLSIASENAIFGQVGPRVGSFDAGFGVGLLARLVGDKKAKEIWFLCRQYSAEEALAMNLVNKVVPLADLEAEGVQWADEILAMSPTAIRFLKSAFLVATDGLAGLQEFAGNATGPVLHDRRGARGLDGVPREAPARVPKVPAPPVSPDPASGSSPPVPRRCPRRCPAWSSGSGPRPGAAARCASIRRWAAWPSRCCSRSSPTSPTTCRTSGGAPTRRIARVRCAWRPRASSRSASWRWRSGSRSGSPGVVGLWLAYVGGPVLIVLGLLAVVAALAYTGGPWPYGYRGLGEVFVFVFFGLVAVVGTAYLQTGRLEALYWAAAIPAGALITAILVVNNLRDIPTDTAAGKRTLAVMVGEPGAKAEYAVLLACGVSGACGPRVRRPVVARAGAAVVAAAGGAAAADGARVRGASGAEPRAQGNGAAGAGVRAPVRGRAGGAVIRIASLRADRVAVRFRRPFPVAAGMWNAREAWILRLIDADGRVGVGEAVVEPDDGEVAGTVLESLVREAVSMARRGPPADGRRARGARAAGPGAAGGARWRAVRPRRVAAAGAPRRG